MGSGSGSVSLGLHVEGHWLTRLTRFPADEVGSLSSQSGHNHSNSSRSRLVPARARSDNHVRQAAHANPSAPRRGASALAFTRCALLCSGEKEKVGCRPRAGPKRARSTLFPCERRTCQVSSHSPLLCLQVLLPSISLPPSPRKSESPHPPSASTLVCWPSRRNVVLLAMPV